MSTSGSKDDPGGSAIPTPHTQWLAVNDSATTILDELRSGPPTVSVERAAELLGISRAYAYTRIKSGDIPVIRIGTRRVRVPTVALLRMLSG